MKNFNRIKFKDFRKLIKFTYSCLPGDGGTTVSFSGAGTSNLDPGKNIKYNKKKIISKKFQDNIKNCYF